MAPGLLEGAAMRYLGLLFTFSLIASPAIARKHQKHPQHVQARRAPAPPAAEPAPPPPPVVASAPPRGAQVAQVDDDEVPGKKHKK